MGKSYTDSLFAFRRCRKRATLSLYLDGASRMKYRSGLWIRCLCDVPSDFPIPIAQSDWCRALLIPASGQVGPRSAWYPPRIYILTRYSLIVLGHPRSEEQPFIVKLSDLAEIRSSKGDLSGSLHFTGTGFHRQFRYQVEQHRKVDSFLCAVRSRWLTSTAEDSRQIEAGSRDSEFLKRYQYVLQTELDRDEEVIGFCFQPTRIERNKQFFLIRSRSTCAFCIVLTNRRLMMITFAGEVDSDRNCISVRSYPSTCVETGSVDQIPEGGATIALTLSLRGKDLWRLSIERNRLGTLVELLKQLRCSGEEKVRSEGMVPI